MTAATVAAALAAAQQRRRRAAAPVLPAAVLRLPMHRRRAAALAAAVGMPSVDAGEFSPAVGARVYSAPHFAVYGRLALGTVTSWHGPEHVTVVWDDDSGAEMDDTGELEHVDNVRILR